MSNTQALAQLGIRTRHSFQRGDRHLAYSITPPEGVLDDVKTREDYIRRVLTALLIDKQSQLYSEYMYIDVTEDAERFRRLAEEFIAEERRKLRRTNRFRFYWQRRVVPGIFLLSMLFFANRHYRLGDPPPESIKDLAYAGAGLGAGFAYVVQNVRFYAGLVILSALQALILAGIAYGAGRLYAKWRLPEAEQVLDYSALLTPIQAINVPQEQTTVDERDAYNDPF